MGRKVVFRKGVGYLHLVQEPFFLSRGNHQEIPPPKKEDKDRANERESE